MNLICINNLYNEAQLAKSLIDALPDDVFILFIPNQHVLKDFLTIYPNLNCKFTCDYDFIFLNAANIKACFTFGALSIFTMTHVSNSIFAAFFKEISVPVIDIQHGLFQYGLNLMDGGKCAGISNGTFCLPVKNMTEFTLEWGGQNGIGYLKSENDICESLNDSSHYKLPESLPKKFALIITNFHAKYYSNDERFIFLYAICQFIRKHPEINFLLKAHNGEISSNNEVYNILNSLSLSRALSNLHISPNKVSLSYLVKKSEFVITTPSTSILTIELLKKPAFIFNCDILKDKLSELKSVKTFNNFESINKLYNQYLNDIEKFVPNTGIPAFNKEKLKNRLNLIMLSVKDNKFSIGVALKYIEIFRLIIDAFSPKTVTLPEQKTDLFIAELKSISNHVGIISERANIVNNSLLLTKTSNVLRFIIQKIRASSNAMLSLSVLLLLWY